MGTKNGVSATSPRVPSIRLPFATPQNECLSLPLKNKVEKLGVLFEAQKATIR
jgi:hypothetical protein